MEMKSAFFLYFVRRIFGQKTRPRLGYANTFMLLPLFVRSEVICLCCAVFFLTPAAVFSQTNYYSTNGTEYAVVGSLPGDQVYPDVAVTASGGFVVWQDNATDGSGWGVSAS